MSDPFLPLLSEDATRQAILDAGVPEVLARVNVFRATFNHPAMGRIVGEIVDAIVLNSVLDARTREVAILRTGWQVGSVYEWSNHVPIARRAGLSDDEIAAIRTRTAASAVLTERDLLAIDVVDEVLDHVAVSPTTLETARTMLGNDKAALELVMIPGFYRTIATVLLTAAIPLEDRANPWAPDGQAPAGTGAS